MELEPREVRVLIRLLGVVEYDEFPIRIGLRENGVDGPCDPLFTVPRRQDYATEQASSRAVRLGGAGQPRGSRLGNEGARSSRGVSASSLPREPFRPVRQS